VASYCRNSTPHCADAKAVLTEMQHYGLILADNGSNWYFGGAAFPRWPDGLVELLKRIPARNFVAVNESDVQPGHHPRDAVKNRAGRRPRRLGLARPALLREVIVNRL